MRSRKPVASFIVLLAVVLSLSVLGIEGLRRHQSFRTDHQFVTVSEARWRTRMPSMVGTRVNIRATVTYRDPQSGVLYVQDDTDALLVSTSSRQFNTEAGDLVEIHGQVAPSRGGISAAEISVLGKNHLLPPAEPMPLGAVAEGERFFDHKVEVSGVVHSVGFKDGRYAISLVSRSGAIRAQVLAPVGDFSLPLGSVVRVRGVCAASSDTQNHVQEVHVLVSSVDEISVEALGPTDPYSLRLTAPNALRQPRVETAQFVHLRGTVVDSGPGTLLINTTERGSVRIFSVQSEAVTLGKKVDVVGFQDLKALPEIQLYDAVHRPSTEEPHYALGPPRQGDRDTEGTIVHISDLKNLSPEQAGRRLPVHFRATVTYFDPAWHLLFIQDGIAGVYVNIHDNPVTVNLGDVVDVRGVSDPGDFAPIIARPAVQVLRRGVLPVPQLVEAQSANINQSDCRLIRTRAIVRFIRKQDHHLLFDLKTGSDRIVAQLADSRGVSESSLIDGEIEIVGVAGTLYNDRRQAIGAQIFIPSAKMIKVVRAPAPDSFNRPAQEIRGLFRYDPAVGVGHRTKIQGVVVLTYNDGTLFIRDRSGSLLVHPAEKFDTRTGDVVEVLGFPSVEGYSPVLVDAVLRKTGASAIPQTVYITAADALTGRFDSEYISIDGRLVEKRLNLGTPVLVLQSDHLIFEAEWRPTGDTVSFDSLRVGSQVRLKGVCVVVFDRNVVPYVPTSVRVLMASPTDLTVLEQGSWWTFHRAARALAITCFAGIWALLWIAILRRQVRQKTDEISRTLQGRALLEQQYKEIFDDANDIILTVDHWGSITSINPAFEKITGYTAEQARVAGFRTIFGPEFGKLLGGLLAGTSTPKSNIPVEIVARDGSTLTLELNSAIRLKAGTVESVQIIARDVTEKRRLETQVQHAQKMDALGQLAGGMTHDFNNLLSVISGYSELLGAELPDGSDQRRYAQGILDATRRASSLTQKLLSYTRKQVSVPTTFSVRNAVLELAEVLSALFKGEVQLEVSPDQYPVNVRIDRSQFEQVVINLVSNAKDSISGVGVVKVVTRSCTPRDDLRLPVTTVPKGDYVVLSVIDNGCGMSPVVLSKVFEPFFTTKQREKGTGLGLAIVYSIVSRAGGYISVVSHVGAGTTFDVYLPVCHENEPTQHSDSTMLRPHPLTGRILLVEDEERFRDATRDYLRRQGLEVLEACNGEEALQIARALPVDIVLTDLVMPGMNGKELAARLRADKPGLPIIFMSGYNDGITLETEDGARETLLCKPFSFDSLAAKLEEFMTEARPTVG